MSRPKVVAESLPSLAAAEEHFRIGGAREADAVDWGDPWLDAAVGPLLVGGAYVVAGRTGTGKSFTVLRMLLGLDVPALYVSLEDPLREVGRRVSVAPFPPSAKERVRVLIPAAPTLGRVRAVMVSSGARVVAVDYLQILQDDSGIGTFDRAGQVRNIVSALKADARVNGQSLILAAQLRRPQRAEDGEDQARETRGTIFDIRDSSDVENQAEAVLLLHRLGRKEFDESVAKVKGRLGGERRKFARGPGGFPIPAGNAVTRDEEEPF